MSFRICMATPLTLKINVIFRKFKRNGFQPSVSEVVTKSCSVRKFSCSVKLFAALYRDFSFQLPDKLDSTLILKKRVMVKLRGEFLSILEGKTQILKKIFSLNGCL